MSKPLPSPPLSPCSPHAPPAPRPGDVIAQRYLLQTKLGAGGHATVWLAQQLTTQRLVALKLLDHTQCEPEQLTRFMREAQILSSLNHPNTVTCYDFGADLSLGLHFLSMEYVEGQTLHDLIRTQGPLPPFQALPLIRQIAASLDDAHSHGLLHRDLKPANIMLSQRNYEETIKLIDFGIARFVDPDPNSPALTRHDIVIGTVHYMAPEQILRHDLSPQTDIYALGVVTFELLTGRRPFEHPNTLELVRRILTDSPPNLHDVSPSLCASSALNLTVLKALNPDPAQRYPSASAFADALDDAILSSTEDRTLKATIADIHVALDAVLNDPLHALQPQTPPQQNPSPGAPPPNTPAKPSPHLASTPRPSRSPLQATSFLLGAGVGTLLGSLWTFALM
jgi:eukaryotic-like serine/threonine-protein kinase